MRRAWMWLNLYGFQAGLKKVFLVLKMHFSFCFFLSSPIRSVTNLWGTMDGPQFWWLPWFPAQNNTCVNICKTVYVCIRSLILLSTTQAILIRHLWRSTSVSIVYHTVGCVVGLLKFWFSWDGHKNWEIFHLFLTLSGILFQILWPSHNIGFF